MESQLLALLDVADRVLMVISSTLARYRVSRNQEDIERLKKQVENLNEVIEQLRMQDLIDSSVERNLRFLILHLGNNPNPNPMIIARRIRNIINSLKKIRMELEEAFPEPDLERVRKDVEWLREYVVDVKDLSVNPVVMTTLDRIKEMVMSLEPPEERPDLQDMCLEDLSRAERHAVENNKSAFRRVLANVDASLRRWLIYMKRPEVARAVEFHTSTEDAVFSILKDANGNWMTLTEIQREYERRAGTRKARTTIEAAVKKLIKKGMPIELDESVRPKRVRYVPAEER